MASSATLSGSSSSKSWRRSFAIALLAVASLMSLWFLWHFAVPYFLHYNQAQFDYFWPRRNRLLIHISGGFLALVCGTLQMWTGLRQKAMNFHRWTGRFYVLGVGVGTIGVFLTAIETTPRSFGAALIAMGIAWSLTTAIAWAAILRGQLGLHREWVLRSYLVTFAFVTFRLMSDTFPILSAKLGNNPDDASANITWLSWVLPLTVYEMIRLRKRFSTNNA